MIKVKVLNIQFDAVTLEEARQRVLDFLKRGIQGYIVTPNPEIILEAEKNPSLVPILNKAFLSIPDGIGILWAETYQRKLRHRHSFLGRFFTFITTFTSLALLPRLSRKVFPERVTGTDLMQALCDSHLSYSIFLLGAMPGVAEKTAEILKKKNPNLDIIGTWSGSPRDEDFPEIKKEINALKPEILFVAFGAPAQEFWIAKHLHELPSVKVAMGIGGAFDFIVEKRKRAPKFMQKTGTEWLFRLIQEPSRWRRIYNAAIRFPFYIAKRSR
ncbi:MAG: WecB/TagA/CpsF family glycosyltransferase [Patescibacteria group bacterium]